jgi:hypothetical protein
MYRRCADVAHSDLAKFGVRNGIDNLRPLALGDPHNWRSAGATAAVRELAARFYSPEMNPHDAAALFWLARNQLFFDLDLAHDPTVLLCQYEYLTHHPAAALQRIYRFAGVPGPAALRIGEVRPADIAGTHLELSPAIREVCEQLQARLDAQFSVDWT